MEASRGPREADVAPAPSAVEPTGGVTAGWTPADPGPLGLAAFAATTFTLSMLNANLVHISAIPIVLSLALAYGGIVQIIAGIWEFRTGNTFGAVAFCSYGGFWLSVFFLFHGVGGKLVAAHEHSADRALPVDVVDLHDLHVHRLAADIGGGRS